MKNSVFEHIKLRQISHNKQYYVFLGSSDVVFYFFLPLKRELFPRVSSERYAPFGEFNPCALPQTVHPGDAVRRPARTHHRLDKLLLTFHPFCFGLTSSSWSCCQTVGKDTSSTGRTLAANFSYISLLKSRGLGVGGRTDPG